MTTGNIVSRLVDVVMIAKTESIDYEQYQALPLERIDLYRNLTQLRMIYFDGGFRSHLEILNKALYGRFSGNATNEQKRKMLSIWNMVSLNSILALSPLINQGLNCKIINNFDAEQDLFRAYCDQTPRPLIAISATFILSWVDIKRLVGKIRAYAPDAKIVMGGAFANDQYLNGGVSLLGKMMVRYGIDYVLHGFNSELDLMQLALRYRDGGLSDIPNLVYVDDKGNAAATAEAWHQPNLGEDPIPWDKIDLPEQTTTVQIRTSSGCPFSCSFCTYPVSAGGFHVNDPDMGLKVQLEKIRGINSISSLIFIDDTLNVPVSRFKKILDIMQGFDFTWYSFLRAQFVDDNIVRQMKDSGCDGVYLGIESANDTILRNMNKNVSVEEYRRGIALLKKHGIPVLAAFVLGFPGEDESTIRDNISFINDTGLDYYSLKEFYYLHSAPVHEKTHEFGLHGMGHEWRHNSMTSRQASGFKLEMFDAIHNSEYVDADTSLWYLAYLRGRGLDWGGIKKVQTVLNEMIGRDNRGNFEDKDDLLSALRAHLSPILHT